MSKERQLVFNKYCGHCAYCGCELGNRFHVDHLLPVKRKKKAVEGRWITTQGGKDVWIKRHFIDDGFDFPDRDVLSNKVPSCPSCNIVKRDQDIEQFRAMIANFINSLNKRFVQYKFVKTYGLIQETGNEVVFYFEQFKKDPSGV